MKLPGSSAKEPNVYPFGTPYQTIYDDLRRKVRYPFLQVVTQAGN